VIFVTQHASRSEHLLAPAAYGDTRSKRPDYFPKVLGWYQGCTAGSKIGRPDWRSLAIHHSKKGLNSPETSSVRRLSAFERTSDSGAKSMAGNSRRMAISKRVMKFNAAT
jgi:hypothetical protein